MIRWRRGPRQHPERVVPPVGASTWSRRVLLWGLAIGLVVMHHMVGAHQHGPDDPIPVAAPATSGVTVVAASILATDAPALGGHHSSGPDASVDRPAGTASAQLHRHPDPAGHGEHGTASMLHMCLAVLAGALALAALAVVSWWWPTAAQVRRPSVRLGPAVLPRPPPVPLRLAQLQILRL